MLPVEVGEPTIRRELDNLKLNEEYLKTELDLLQEMRDKEKVREKACKQRAARRYNSKTKSRSFQEGEQVSRMRGEARKSSVFRPVDRDVFVRDLNCQLGTPPTDCLWIPAKKEDKEAP